MNVTTEKIVYLVAQKFLWAVCSALYHIFEDHPFQFEEEHIYLLPARVAKWDADADAVAGWALQHSLLKDEPSLPAKKRRILVQTISQKTDLLVWDWGRQIFAAVASSKKEVEWSGDERMPLYFFYCGWLLYVLRSFQEINEQLTTSAPQLLMQADSIRQEYERLLKTLHDEVVSIGSTMNMDNTMTEQVRTDIETTGKVLAEQWRQAVYKTVKQIQTKE